VDAVSCELFSTPISLLTGKNTGNITRLIGLFGDNSMAGGGLTAKAQFLVPIGTGNDQGMTEIEIP
jgi:hypothetical protein